MSMTTVTAGNTALATDLNQIIQHLQGQAGSTEAWHFRSSGGNDYLITLADDAGARSISIRDSGGSVVASIDSDGKFTGNLAVLTTAGDTLFRNASTIARLGIGTAGQVLTVNGGATAPEWTTLSIPAAAPIALAASNTAEQSTTSTTPVDLISFASLSIPVGKTVKIVVGFRKTAGAAQRVRIGLKVNATTVHDGINVTSTNDRAEEGMIEFILTPRSTDYLAGMYGTFGAKISATGAVGQIGDFVNGQTLAALIPNATITDLAIRSYISGAGITGAVKDVRVYVLD